jgi:hypothetical protein
MIRDISTFWALTAEEAMRHLGTGPEGLTESEAQKRLKEYGSNLLKPRKESRALLLLLSQFKSPIILLLIFAAALSIYLHQNVEAGLILVIVFISGLLGFWQERTAADAVTRLLAIVRSGQCAASRRGEGDFSGGSGPGDIVLLNAGDIIPETAAFWSPKTSLSTKPRSLARPIPWRRWRKRCPKIRPWQSDATAYSWEPMWSAELPGQRWYAREKIPSSAESPGVWRWGSRRRSLSKALDTSATFFLR